MKILTTVKKVVDVELNIRVNDGAIVEDGLQYVINAWDENAVEAAVQLKEKNKAKTTLVSIGGGDNADIIRKCYAMGIDDAIHVDDPALAKADSAVYAKLLQKVVEKGEYDLILTGKQAQDTDSGQTGIILAEYLNYPCASNVVDIEIVDDTKINVSRLGDSGVEKIELNLPAVVTVSDSINEPRLPAMRGIMMAKKKKIKSMGLADLDTSAEDIGCSALKSEITEFMASEKRKGGRKFEGDPAAVTAEVVGLLSTEAKIF